MCNHQTETNTGQLYRNEYTLKNGQTLVVRNAVAEDAQALVDHMKIVDSETKFLAREPGEFSFTVDQEREFIEKTHSNKSIFFAVGEVNGQIVANCSVGLVMSHRRYSHRASMGIAIRKAFWRLGIGKQLMSECIQWCKNNGIEQLELDVVTENDRAVAMYKSFGFEIQGSKRHALKYDDGSYVDEHSMILFVNN